MMKSRAFRIAAAIALVATVSACSSASTPTKKVYTYKDMTVGFIQTGSESGWRAANTSSFKETATEKGINLKFYDSQNKIENQITAFNQYIQDPAVNVIVLAAVGTTGYDDSLRAAKAAGKVVVIEDRRIEADSTLYYTYIGSDFDAEGQKGAKAMCDLLKNGTGTKVVEIGGDQAASAAIDRAKGFREKMGDCGITITATQSAPGWDPVQGKAIMEAYLKNSKDIQGVYAHNDELGIAAIQAIEAAGLKAGTGPTDIKVVAFDATANGFKYLISGKLGADIECNPLLAPQVYDAALKALNGDTSLPKWVPSQEGEFFASQGADALQAILATRKY
jgi:ABC-type sugar transport system substrate-binding protein